MVIVMVDLLDVVDAVETVEVVMGDVVLMILEVLVVLEDEPEVVILEVEELAVVPPTPGSFGTPPGPAIICTIFSVVALKTVGDRASC
jgi:hypothetical protein